MSGRLPYEAASLSELTLKQQREAPIPLDELNPEVPRALAQAVAWALAMDQRARPEDAIELAEALRAGARGVATQSAAGPGGAGFATGATRVVPDEERTAATRVTPRDAPPQARPQAPRQVASRVPERAEPARARARDAQAPAGRAAAGRASAGRASAGRAPRSAGRGFRRLMGLLALMAVLALIVIAAVLISDSTSTTVVHYQKVIAKDAQDAINQLQGLISRYTK